MKKYNYNLLVAIVFIVSFILSVSFVIYSCNNKKRYNPQTETLTTEATKTDSIYIDTLPIIDNPITPYVNQDSLDRVELIRDSIQFRKITKKINGGLNGFADRYAMWLRARNSINK
jgi:predicted metal-binding protein